jgi:hypothetical protein
MSVDSKGLSMTLKNFFRLFLITVLLCSLSGTALAQSTAVFKGLSHGCRGRGGAARQGGSEKPSNGSGVEHGIR